MLVIVWVIQGLCMFFDEFYFHHRRGLGRWESIGHPVDTLFFLLPFIFCLNFSPVELSESIFIASSIISTLIITKDEWIHAEQSSPAENWLHSLLFILHPLSLGVLYFYWKNGENFLITFQTGIISLFFIYQVVYWNILKKDRYEIKN